MGQARQKRREAADQTLTPPSALTATQSIARMDKALGNNTYSCTLPSGSEIIVELPSRLRNTVWIRRGGYVLIDTAAEDLRETKAEGMIENIVGNEKAWRKEAYWWAFQTEQIPIGPADLCRPKEFPEFKFDDESDDDESTVGKMPPSDSESES